MASVNAAQASQDMSRTAPRNSQPLSRCSSRPTTWLMVGSRPGTGEPRSRYSSTGRPTTAAARVSAAARPRASEPTLDMLTGAPPARASPAWPRYACDKRGDRAARGGHGLNANERQHGGMPVDDDRDSDTAGAVRADRTP